ncbi:MAG: hypothetical protein INR73_06260 [Williamsia sp.]|nr:hypothetical protein [Williamsia sp.]
MENSIGKLIAPLLNESPVSKTSVKTIGRSIADHKYQIINVAGAVLISYVILKILQERRNSGRFQLSDFTEG